jgi:hypothetical protein
MKFKPLPAGFVIPAQPVKASKPPSGAAWVHEIKHDGYRLIVRRDGPSVRLYSRNANDWTARLSAIATTARRIKAKSYTIDGEAIVPGPDGLSGLFDELRRREGCQYRKLLDAAHCTNHLTNLSRSFAAEVASFFTRLTNIADHHGRRHRDARICLAACMRGRPIRKPRRERAEYCRGDGEDDPSDILTAGEQFPQMIAEALQKITGS